MANNKENSTNKNNEDIKLLKELESGKRIHMSWDALDALAKAVKKVEKK